MSAGHLLRVASNYLTFNREMMDAAIELVTMKPHGEIRLKDTVEVLRSCYEFDYKPSDDAIESILKEVSSSPDLFVYPYYFLVFLTIIASFQNYPHELFDKCFQESFIRLLQQNVDFQVNRHLLILHTILTLEQPEKYKGKLLTHQEVFSMSSSLKRKDIHRMTLRPIPNKGPLLEFCYQQMYQQAKEAFGPDRVIYSFILPYSESPFLTLLPKGKDVHWFNNCSLEPGSMQGVHILNVMNVTHFSDSSNIRYRGYFATQVRLLKKLGIQVHNFHWSDLRRPSKEFSLRLKKLVN